MNEDTKDQLIFIGIWMIAVVIVLSFAIHTYLTYGG
jgi:hypothetical protein